MNAFATLPDFTGGRIESKGAELRATTQAQTRALDGFLAGVERKAFRIAQIALRHEQDALDAVQDAMLQLVRHYSGRPEADWKPLFYRILENRVRDFQRRRTVRGRVMAWLPWSTHDDDAREDPIEQAPDPSPDPFARVADGEMLQALERALHALPARQRQAFMLRSLEGMDVAESAAAMGCSEGSVKTHYFRALQTLRAGLGDFWQPAGSAHHAD